MYGTPEDILYLVDPFIFLLLLGGLLTLLLVAIFFPAIKRRFARPERTVASVVGLFPRIDEAARTVRQLREAGIGGNRVSVLSSIPYPEGAFETDTGRMWIRTFGLVGGILGALAGITLISASFLVYPLQTGGKPQLPIPVMAVITYEMTVLSVMLFSLSRFLFEARLPSTGTKFNDPRISDGMVGIIVRCETEEQARRAEQTVSSLGATDIRLVQGRVD